MLVTTQGRAEAGDAGPSGEGGSFQIQSSPSESVSRKWIEWCATGVNERRDWVIRAEAVSFLPFSFSGVQTDGGAASRMDESFMHTLLRTDTKEREVSHAECPT